MAVKVGKKQGAKNIGLNVLAFGIQFIISFYISPIIVEKVGTSAYGFIGLANDFVSYAAILATVFNSVAARFIANAYYKEEYEVANKYFNSLVCANLAISVLLGIVSIALVPCLDLFLTIPENLVFDVKLTFALIFASYIITVITMVFTTSTFVTNRTDIQGIRNIIQYIVRFACIVLFLNFVSIRIYWIALASAIACAIVSILNISITKKLTPELKINLKCAHKSYAFELAKSGSWMALTSISVILLRGLDLTIANLMIGDYEMGLLSIARTMPNNATSIIGTIAPIFTPVFIMFYAKNDMNGLVCKVKNTIRTMALIMFVPITSFIVFSYDFYGLWQKSLSEQERKIVTVLSIMTIIQAYFNATTSTMAQLSVVVNKLRLPVIVSFACGILSFVVEVLLIKLTDMGLYAIVLSTTVIMIIRYVLFNPMYAAWCLKQPLKIFMGTTIKTWLPIPFLLGIMFALKKLFPVSSWSGLVLGILICALVGYCIMIALFGRNELKQIIGKLKRS